MFAQAACEFRNKLAARHHQCTTRGRRIDATRQQAFATTGRAIDIQRGKRNRTRRQFFARRYDERIFIRCDKGIEFSMRGRCNWCRCKCLNAVVVRRRRGQNHVCPAHRHVQRQSELRGHIAQNVCINTVDEISGKLIMRRQCQAARFHSKIQGRNPRSKTGGIHFFSNCHFDGFDVYFLFYCRCLHAVSPFLP